MKKLLVILMTVVFGCLNVNAEDYSLVLAADTFNTKSYAANDGDHIVYGSDDKPYVFTTTSVMKNQYSQVQFSKGSADRTKGTIEAIIPEISKVVVNLGTSEYMNLTVIIGNDTISPIATDKVYTFTAENKANKLLIVNDSKSRAASQESIIIYYSGEGKGTELNGNQTPMVNKVEKAIYNGQLVIYKDGKSYNVNGKQIN